MADEKTATSSAAVTEEQAKQLQQNEKIAQDIGIRLDLLTRESEIEKEKAKILGDRIEMSQQELNLQQLRFYLCLVLSLNGKCLRELSHFQFLICH